MSKKILVVDDEPTIVRVLESRLKHEKYEVVIARDGDEGYEKTLSERPDLIILDVLMPGLTGYQLVEKLRDDTDDDYCKQVPIVVMSARPTMKDFFPRWKIKTFIPKPFKPEDLVRTIHEIIGPA